MALFTDFFPEGGGENVNQYVETTFANAIAGFNIATQVALGGQTVELTNTTAQASLQPMDYIRITIGTSQFTGQITTNTNDTAWLVMLDAPARAVIAPTTDGSVSVVEFTSAGQTTINGDVVVAGGGDIYTNGGDLNLGDGDITTTGTITATIRGNADTATSLANARIFSIAGDVTAPDISFNGTQNVAFQAEINQNVITTRELASGAVQEQNISTGAVTNAKINANVAGNGLAQGAGGQLDVTTGAGLEIDSDTVRVAASIAGSGLAFSNGVLNVEALNVNNTHAYTGTGTTDAAVLTSLVTAFNTAGTASGGITVASATQFNSGDLILLTNAATPPNTESYIYTGADRTADGTPTSNTIAASDFIDITHSGDVVETLTAGPGITITGGATNPTVAVLARPSGPINVNAQGVSLNSAAYGAGITAGANGEINVVGGTNITAAADAINLDAALAAIQSISSPTTGDTNLGITATGELRIAGTGITSGTDAEPGFLAVGTDGHVVTADPTSGISGTANTYSIFTANGLGNGQISQSTAGDAVTIAQNTTITPLAGTGTRNVAVNASGQLIAQVVEDGPIRYNIVTANITGTPTQTSHGDLIILPPIPGGGGGGGTTTVGTFDVTNLTGRDATTVDLFLSAQDLAMIQVGDTGNILALANPSDTTASTQLTFTVSSIANVNAGSVQATVTPASTVTFQPGVDPTWYFTGVTQSVTFTRGSGSTTTVSTFALPASPAAGESVKVSNLSATGTGSGTNRWGFTGHGGVIMRTNVGLNNTFSLDDQTASFELVYTDATNGWVIIGAN